ncbi:hypothetical protein OG453_10615 [Streptomyces sp. NBC_01381]|uniref:hypothetical protein n=1 Tax=Streptomyces sp. NBC_01381 TaxID=2903845 RepID=UPI002251AB18|nr:hypothetical protein [Streptomyces sp. NBC_01381]MCX4667110.1 hypothetical protein [Streptomyces sp. NBC_01381]
MSSTSMPARCPSCSPITGVVPSPESTETSDTLSGSGPPPVSAEIRTGRSKPSISVTAPIGTSSLRRGLPSASRIPR